MLRPPFNVIDAEGGVMAAGSAPSPNRASDGGDHPSLPFRQWVRRLKLLHEKSRWEPLNGRESDSFAAACGQLAAAILAVQRFSLERGQAPRERVRVSASLPVTLRDGQLDYRATTVDISSAGLSVLLPEALKIGHELALEIWLRPPRPVLRSRARVLSNAPRPRAVRVSLSLEGLTGEEQVSLSSEILDHMIGQIAGGPIAGPLEIG